MKSTTYERMVGFSPPISEETRRVLVWSPKEGSITLTLMAATSDLRTSAGSKGLPQKSRATLTMASRKAARCVPPKGVYCPLTNDQTSSL